MTKELVTIEFRYYDEPKSDFRTTSQTKTITIGVFDTFDEAIIEANKALEKFEKKFKLNKFNNIKERFSKTGGCFGTEKRLISNLGYLETNFQFFAKITTLEYDDINETINEILNAGKRYQNYITEKNKLKS
jgi:hypothetical protein